MRLAQEEGGSGFLCMPGLRPPYPSGAAPSPWELVLVTGSHGGVLLALSAWQPGL